VETSDEGLVDGADLARPVDALFVNAPLRDYSVRGRVNDFTLPVLGLGYLATYAASQGFNVGVVDAEARGLGVRETVDLVNRVAPRWVGLNLLAPTYALSAGIAEGVSERARVMVGGHHANAMPAEILADPRFAGISALVVGEGETRVAALLADAESRRSLPRVMWRDPVTGEIAFGHAANAAPHLAPDIDALPFLDRAYLSDDPHVTGTGDVEANMVASRGCPYDCAFCGAAVSSNPGTTIRARQPFNVITEMEALASSHGVNRFRFVDDLFLGSGRLIRSYMSAFSAADIGGRFRWHATGRINVLDRAADSVLDSLRRNGCDEVALGIESGSARLLKHMDKRIDPEMTTRTVERLVRAGINVKGYFILGYPTETLAELDETVAHVRELWRRTENTPGRFRASVFEFRPYPGTPEWTRLMATGKFTASQLLDYAAIDLTDGGLDEAMRERDEFNFSVNIQFGEADVATVRERLVDLAREQHDRRNAA
jgi:radical SAM superfamily enzyme YgiQ (UPF0313 family)